MVLSCKGYFIFVGSIDISSAHSYGVGGIFAWGSGVKTVQFPLLRWVGVCYQAWRRNPPLPPHCLTRRLSREGVYYLIIKRNQRFFYPAYRFLFTQQYRYIKHMRAKLAAYQHNAEG
jgi:hypothetical protein